ncbi:ABC transporter ATP-binding protein [Pusillimonas sp.]|uniref:ABC transporter ATP-binding protein n=1 Tax=Pusillimonas sp. TaxID=3040095 RepID=UPI0029A026F1|nr:ABC transporter ATP-binding protein [Pusillimonas sp.]MDX3894660.1 ABC transporter ATP-binding protein [Pusillimonas sp.]
MSVTTQASASGRGPGHIAFRHVSKVYPGKSGQGPTLALDTLNFDIAESEIVSILGPTGCGKSSTLNMIAGFEAPTQGEVLLDGVPVVAPGPQRAVVFQQAALFPWLNVMDNVVLGVKAQRQDKSVYLERARALLDEMGLAGFEGHYPYQLSGGMQQRVQIARAMVAQPRILLMDEPFGALDYQTRIQMQELLLRLWQEHRPTVFFITHDIAEAIFVSDRILIMSSRPGRIRLEVRVRASKPRSQEFLSSNEFIALQKQLLHAMQGLGADEREAA